MHTSVDRPARQTFAAQRRRALGTLGWLCSVPWTSALLFAPAGAQGTEPGPIDVKVERAGDKVLVTVVAHVQAAPAEVWAVLTDFEGMPSFTSTILRSTVQQRQGNHLQVAQTSQSQVAMFTFTASSVRAVELQPMHEIRTRLVSGDFKSYDTVTRIKAETLGSTHGPASGPASAPVSGSVIEYSGEYVSTSWIPPMIGPGMVADQIRKHYGQLLTEVLRRQQPGGK